MFLLESGGGGASVFLLIPLIGLYFLPTIVATVRGVANTGSVAVINVFLGWTLIGWVVALAMAARTVNRPGNAKAPGAQAGGET